MNKVNFLAVLFLILSINCNAQTYGGIEIGSKGVKISVIEVKNIKKSVYDIKQFWTENVGIAKGISIDGNLIAADIDNAGQAVLRNYQKLLSEYKIEDSKIFIVASSGVGLAKNTAVLVNKIKELTNKNMEVISSQLESKLSFKGCIPPKYYDQALLIDIGGGNTKGGYVDVVNDENTVFFPLNLDLGTITLTEKIKKKINTEKIADFTNETILYSGSLKTEVFDMLNKRAKTFDKKNIYTSGGAIWAFYTLSTEAEAPENFNSYTIDDVLKYDQILKYNFEKFQTLAKTDKEIDRVLTTYSQKHLISANSILISCLQNLDIKENKKIFFVKNGQVAWLLSYIADSAKGSKVIY